MRSVFPSFQYFNYLERGGEKGKEGGEEKKKVEYKNKRKENERMVLENLEKNF